MLQLQPLAQPPRSLQILERRDPCDPPPLFAIEVHRVALPGLPRLHRSPARVETVHTNLRICGSAPTRGSSPGKLPAPISGTMRGERL